MSEESLLEFPCDLPIKIFGRNVDGFRATVVAIVGSHFEEPADDDIRERLSRDDGYASLTITIRAQTREEVDALYRELSDSDDIMMVL